LEAFAPQELPGFTYKLINFILDETILQHVPLSQGLDIREPASWEKINLVREILFLFQFRN
jgi:hypothetical protein